LYAEEKPIQISRREAGTHREDRPCNSTNYRNVHNIYPNIAEVVLRY
jgi:hypothetical protein